MSDMTTTTTTTTRTHGFSITKENTTARGYGWQHQKARAAALKTVVGTQCTRCGETFTADDRDFGRLHYDHTDDRQGYLGFAHPRCNITAGSQRGLSIKFTSTTTVTTVTA